MERNFSLSFSARGPTNKQKFRSVRKILPGGKLPLNVGCELNDLKLLDFSLN